MKLSLLQLGRGKKGVVDSLEGGFEFQRKMASLNIRTGKTIRKITSQPLGGPVVIEVTRRRIALGRGMAMKIFVEAEE